HQLFIGKDTLKISENLYVAICHLRHQLEPRFLWVDAVCINQASDEEKSHQVGQMHYIYSNASKVLIWLGQSDKDIDQAMEFLQDSRETRDKREKPLVGLRKMFSSRWWFRMLGRPGSGRCEDGPIGYLWRQMRYLGGSQHNTYTGFVEPTG